MKAVILAGGLGSRLSEETDKIPKPMVTVGGNPILWHVMKIYMRFNVTDFVICLGYKGYVIKEYFQNYALHHSDITLDMKTGERKVHQSVVEPWRVTLVDTGNESMTGGRIRRVEDWISDGTFCLTYGDGVSDLDIDALIRFHRSHGKLATVTTIYPPGRFGVLRMDGDQVVGFSEKADSRTNPISGGFFVLEPKVLDYIQGDETIWEREPMERLAAEGQLMSYMHEGFWYAMDTIRDRRHLEDLWNGGNAPWKTWA
ncbi:MAG: glucose-1-phosphate cytidylyltransferase [Alphaproteobacteria bacterium]|nr:glucose-1-phosphate cytidylyltransferase [Alphaproteobacteria bacterium]